MDAVLVKSVEKKYGRRDGVTTVLDGISLKVKKGEFVGLIGPNGCGKTTLLKLILGVENPNKGTVSVLGKAPDEVRVGYVPQHNTGSLYPWFTAAENIAFAHPSGNGKAGKRALDKLGEFGIRHYANAYPYQLSGGIKQLVSIARATVGSEVFLFDEPFNALDYQNRFLVEKRFLRLRDGRNSALLVSHDIEPTILTCDRLVILSKKPTRIRAVLPVNLPGKRKHEARFSREFNLILQQVYGILSGG